MFESKDIWWSEWKRNPAATWNLGQNRGQAKTDRISRPSSAQRIIPSLPLTCFKVCTMSRWCSAHALRCSKMHRLLCKRVNCADMYTQSGFCRYVYRAVAHIQSRYTERPHRVKATTWQIDAALVSLPLPSPHVAQMSDLFTFYSHISYIFIGAWLCR